MSWSILEEAGGWLPPPKPKRMIYGVAKGAGVYLGPVAPGQEFVVAEGIESALSAMLLAGRSLNGGKALGGVAAISATGLVNLTLRKDMQRILIGSDNDENKTGQRAAVRASDHWTAEGREVRVAYPPHVGTDFNDMLLSKGPYATQIAKAAE